MKILLVHSGNKVTGDSSRYSYVQAQGECLQAFGNEVQYFAIVGKGLMGYIRSIRPLRHMIRTYKPDVIHAHYGLSCLLVNLATRRVPVVSTYHGSDINSKTVRPLSKIAMWLSAWNIFVSRQSKALAGTIDEKKYSLIPCGVALSDDQLQPRENAREKLGWKDSDCKILFAGGFENDVKDPELAKAAVALLDRVELIELKGYTREQVNTLMCAVDAFLMTSKTEGSPQVIKEAMACGCPIVSVNVGDVAERVANLDGCYVVPSREPKDIAQALQKALTFKGKTMGRERIIKDKLTNEQVSERVRGIYKQILNMR